MTDKEKAKAYDEALERAKKVNKCEADDREPGTSICEYIFPVLKESEDERIRKTLVELVKCNERSGYKLLNNIPTSSMLAWLEKQESVEEIVERCKTSWYNEGKIQGQIEGLSDEEKYQQGWHDALEKQGKKKFAWSEEDENLLNRLIGVLDGTNKEDYHEAWEEKFLPWLKSLKETLCDKCKKAQPSHSCQDITALGRCYIEGMNTSNKIVEQKFKVGDWVVQENISTYKVIEVCESWYEVIDVEDNHYSIAFDKEYMCHLWTIQDAKKGDVLASKDTSSILIFRNLDSSTSFSSYYNTEGKGEDNWSNKCFIPATKEQRDLLFTKMKEAGFEWDAEKERIDIAYN